MSESKSVKSTPILDVPAGDYIFQQGELGTEMFIIHDGQVEILHRVGKENKRLAVLEKGDFFGEMSLLDDRPRNAAARSLTDVKLVPINGSKFTQMLRADPEIAIRIMRKFSRRLREMDELLKGMVRGDGAPVSVTSAEMTTADSQRERKFGPEQLIHEKSGMEFHLLEGEETTVGRKDPVTGIYPGIDLTAVDSQRSTSRRHAKVFRRGSKFYVVESIGTMNGTFVRGVRLETGEPVEARDGDEVRFGMVALTFHVK
ncbi:MAG: cyclic nucleotide-binding domain-containing protein [Acidobacteriota bacterium]